MVGHPGFESVLEMYGKWRPQAYIVEDAGSGTALLSDLGKTTSLQLIPAKVEGSKETRAEATTPLFHAEARVAPDRRRLHRRARHVPQQRHDDLVDASVRALTRIHELRRHDQLESPISQVMRIRRF